MPENGERKNPNLEKVGKLAAEFGWDGCIVYGFKANKSYRVVWSDDRRVVTKLKLMMEYMWSRLDEFFRVFTNINEVKDEISPE